MLTLSVIRNASLSASDTLLVYGGAKQLDKANASPQDKNLLLLHGDTREHQARGARNVVLNSGVFLQRCQPPSGEPSFNNWPR